MQVRSIERRSESPDDLSDSSHDDDEEEEEEPELIALSTWHAPEEPHLSREPIPGPVFFLALNLTHYDQQLFHYYMIPMAEAKFGAHADGRFNLHRDDGYAMMRLHKVVFHWLLVASEMHMKQTITNSVLRRRATAYKITNEAVARFGRQNSQRDDGIIAAVAAAVVMDVSSATMDTRRMHMRGLEALLRCGGGPAHLKEKPSLHRFVLRAHMLCDGGIIQDSMKLRQLQQFSVQMLRDLNTWNRDMNVRICLLGESSQTEALAAYLDARDKLFGPSSHLRKILTRRVPLGDHYEPTVRLCILLNLNLALWDHRHDLEATTHFLNSLFEAMKESTQINPEDGSWRLTCRAVIGLLEKGGFESLRLDVEDKEFWRNWQVISILKVVSRTTDRTRDEIFGILSGWLFGFCAQDSGSWPVLTERECIALERESSRSWHERDSGRSDCSVPSTIDMMT